MRWIELAVAAHPEAVESVAEALSAVAANGVAIEEPFALEDDGQRWRPIPGATVTLRAYLPDNDQAPAAVRRLTETLWHLRSLGAHFAGPLQTQVVDDEDWAETWKAHFHVTRIGRRLVICPSWRQFDPAPADAVIVLDPGMAFGTGLHPTTRLCLEALEDVVRPGDDVLDVGTGSGILALAALRLGAARALGVDVSLVAVRAASENADRNSLADRLRVAPGTLATGPDGEPLIVPAPPEPGEDPTAALGQIMAVAPARVVVANIIARVIGALAPALWAATAPGGTLIASGIIADRRAEAEDPLRAAGFAHLTARQEGDWLAFIGQRAPA